MFYFFLQLALFLSPLSSDPEAPSIIATLEGEPSCFVGDTVGAIMGEAIISQDDIIVQGAEPLHLRRTYSSYNTAGEYSGWVLFPHIHMFIKVDKKKKRVKEIDLSLPSGARLYFTNPQTIGDGREKMVVDIGAHAIGFTNNTTGIISGQTNLKNHSITYKRKRLFSHEDHYKHVNIHLYTPDGGERLYRRYLNREDDTHRIMSFRLLWERLPNGNKIFYEYRKDDRLSKVYTTNNSHDKIYVWIEFHYHKSNERSHYSRNFHIETSDHRRIDYEFSYNEKSEQHYLGHVSGTTPYTDSIAYHGIVKDRKSVHFPRIHGRLINHAPILGIEYYLPGKVNGLDIKDLHYEHVGKVAKLCVPGGPNGEEIALFRFFYYGGKVRGDDHGLKKDGHTDVFDAEGNLSTFHYTKHLRPFKIVQYRFENNVQIPDRITQFLWGPEQFQTIGNLQSQSLFYPDGTLISSRSFEYDERGNVIEEAFCDNLSQQKYGIKYINSHDGFNLILRKEEENGKVTYFSYCPGTNRLIMRLVGDKSRIYRREFFEYNADYILIKEIVDDGTSFDGKDLLGVSVRKIKIITPKKDPPAQDLPQIIEERYFDGAREVLLKKTVLYYNSQAWVVQKDIYDSSEVFRYSLYFTYDSFGCIVEESDPLGRVKRYSYDAQGNQIGVDDPSGEFSTHTTYDLMHRPTEIKIVTKDGKTRTTRHFYDKKGNKTATVDCLGRKTKYDYDIYGHLIKTHHPDLSTEVQSYDLLGNTTSFTDANGHTTLTQYNARGKPLKVTYADGSCEQNVYDPDGILNTSINSLGTHTFYTHDVLGRILTKEAASLSSESFVYNGFEMTAFTDALGITTTYRYDGAGRKIEERRGERCTAYGYDTLGRLQKVVKEESVHLKEYDLLGRVIEERTEDIEGHLLEKIGYSYDTLGNLAGTTAYIEAGPITYRTEYDNVGRKIKEIDPQGNTTYIEYIEDGYLQKITTDPLGVKSLETYDARDRLILLEKNSASNHLLLKEAFSYDFCGNLIRQTSTIFPTGKETCLFRSYDSINRLICMTEAEGTPQEKSTRFTYLAKSLKNEIIKPSGTVIKQTYDALGRLSSIASSDGSCHYVYEYDALDRPIIVKDLISGGISKRNYNIYGEVTEENFPSDYRLQKSYDHLGRKTGLSLPDHSEISYCYDPIYLKTISRNGSTYTYDTYDLSGQLTQAHLIKDLGRLKFSYDSAGLFFSQENPFYTEIIKSRNLCGHITEVISTEVTQFSYDSLYQLSSENSSLFRHTFLHDSHYNRLRKNEENYEINPLNQIVTLNYDPNGNLEKIKDLHFTYDGFDRLIKLIKDKTVAYAFTYDSWHRRLSQTTYLWNQEQWQEAETLFFLYDGDHEIAVLDIAGKIFKLRILGQGLGAEIGATVALELQGHLFAPLHDFRGNITALISPDTKQIVEHYRYSAFGEEHIFDAQGLPLTTSQYDNPWRFAAKYTDSQTHLVFFGRRHYDPSSGRWITPDPKGYNDTVNLYTFVLNNPLSRLDHYGLVADYFPDTPPRFHTPWGGFAQVGSDLSYAFGWTLSNTSYHLVPIPGVRNALISTGNLFQGQVGWYQDPHSYIGCTGETSLSKALGSPHPVKEIYINGILNSENEVRSNAQRISQKYGGGRVDYVYNSSHGLVLDGLESLAGLLKIPCHPQRLTEKLIKETLTQDPQANIFIHSHSQGGIIAYNATTHLPLWMKQQISHFTLGSGKIISDNNFRHVTNYISKYDPVPLTDPFHYLQALLSNQGHVHFMKGNGLPFLDHGYNGKTYQRAEDQTINFVYRTFEEL